MFVNALNGRRLPHLNITYRTIMDILKDVDLVSLLDQQLGFQNRPFPLYAEEIGRRKTCTFLVAKDPSTIKKDSATKRARTILEDLAKIPGCFLPLLDRHRDLQAWKAQGDYACGGGHDVVTRC